MIKRRVVKFFVAFGIFVLLLVYLQSAWFGKFLGMFTLNERNSESLSLDEGKSIKFEIIGYEPAKASLKIKSQFFELSNKNQEVNLEISLLDKFHKEINKVEQEIVLEPLSEKYFSFSIPLAGVNGDVRLKILAKTNEVSIIREKTIFIPGQTINGAVIMDYVNQKLPDLGIIAISVFFLVLALWFIHNHYERSHAHIVYRNKLDRGLIKIEF